MLRIEMLPAEYGDALLVSWGPNEGAMHHLLVDGGLAKTRAVLARRLTELGTPAPLELLVVTHVDNDHINGVLGLLTKAPATIAPKRIWFNAWRQIEPFYDRAGIAEGTKLSTLLETNWAAEWQDEAIVVPEKGRLPTLRLPGPMKLTLLSPDGPKLAKLASAWVDKKPDVLAEEDRAGRKRNPPRLGRDYDVDDLAAIPFNEDDAAANGSSIAFLLEYDGKRVLLGADAHPSVLLRSLNRVSKNGRVKLDAFKLPHHGSERNLSVELLQKIDCKRFLVSTNAVSFEHPDDVCLARVVKHAPGATLYFNYATTRNAAWRRPALQRKHGFAARAPKANAAGYVIEL